VCNPPFEDKTDPIYEVANTGGHWHWDNAS